MEDKMDTSTEYMKVRTRGGASPNGKRRVYFTCHPKDFDLYFDKVCEDIFKTQDCAIYYTADMTEPIPEQYLESDLGQMSLFVMPVTFRLLYEQNRAMDSDYAFATSENHLIPVLPLMMETGIDEFYEKRFGKREYYSPYSQDITAISYEEKLKKYLASILLDDKTVERIRKAFDAYIFLSYRKKDRHHANELMGLIHKNPMYRDVAIWYDEFLTPGEDFEKEIKKALDKSELFTLLVTPNLVNEQNYVQTTEYPYAHEKAQKPILPAEMVETDKDELKKQYPGVTDCVDAHTEALDEAILEGLKMISLRANEDDPEHCYLIGLAYLDGIDVEVNREYAVELITAAAEKEYPDAMEKIFGMYYGGDRIRVNYREALKWAQRLYDYYLKAEGETGENTLTCLNNLASIYGDLGNYKKAQELNEKCYALKCKVLGEEHPDTLVTLNNLACTYNNLGDYQKALELLEKCYALQCEVQGEEHPDTLTTLNNLAHTYGQFGEYKRALELQEKCYALHREVLGEEHPDTLKVLCGLASTYGELGEHKKELELQEKCYALRCKILGEEHPDTLITLNNLASTYGELGEHKKELELQEKCYALQCKALGEEHPDTLTTLNNLAITYGKLGESKKALELFEQCYVLMCKVLGEEYPVTLTTLNNLAHTYGQLGEYKRALELQEKCYALQCKVLGEEHPDTLKTLSNLAYTYGNLGDYKKALELQEKCYALQCKALGEEHPDTLMMLNNLVGTYGKLGDHKKALGLFEQCYVLMCKVLGEEHPDALRSLGNLAWTHMQLADYEKAACLLEKLYASLRNNSDADEDWVEKTLERLAECYDKLGQPEKTTEVRARAVKK